MNPYPSYSPSDLSYEPPPYSSTSPHEKQYTPTSGPCHDTNNPPYALPVPDWEPKTGYEHLYFNHYFKSSTLRTPTGEGHYIYCAGCQGCIQSLLLDKKKLQRDIDDQAHIIDYQEREIEKLKKLLKSK